jgi:hypothetical protein
VPSPGTFLEENPAAVDASRASLSRLVLIAAASEVTHLERVATSTADIDSTRARIGCSWRRFRNARAARRLTLIPVTVAVMMVVMISVMMVVMISVMMVVIVAMVVMCRSRCRPERADQQA